MKSMIYTYAEGTYNFDMKIPHRTKYIKTHLIRGLTYTVRVMKRMPKGHSKDVGCVCYDKQIIYLSSRQTEAQMYSTFCHEYFHCLFPDLPEDIILNFEQAHMELFTSL